MICHCGSVLIKSLYQTYFIEFYYGNRSTYVPQTNSMLYSISLYNVYAK